MKQLLIFLVIVSLVVPDCVFAETGNAENRSALSPTIHVSEDALQALFLLSQKRSAIPGIEAFFTALSSYNDNGRPELPIVFENESVLVESLLRDAGIPDNMVISGNPENLNLLKKLIRREKITVSFEAIRNGRGVFKIIPFDADISSGEISKTAEYAGDWEREIKKFLSRENEQKQTNQDGKSIVKRLFGLTASEFNVISKLIRFAYDYSSVQTYNELLKYYVPMQLEFGLPSLSEVVDAVGGPQNLDEFIADFYAEKILNVSKAARQYAAAENFYNLAQSSRFQGALADIIQGYYSQAGAETGKVFIDQNRIEPMKSHSLVSAFFKTDTRFAIAAIHTHYAGLAEISPTFFLPSVMDICGGVSAGHQNSLILWGDARLGFYLTALENNRPELMTMVYEILRDEALGRPVDFSRLDIYRRSIANYRFYKLIPQGNRLRRGVAFSFTVEEIAYPREVLARIPLQLDEIIQRVWGFWKDEQQADLTEKGNGDNPLEFFKAEWEKARAAQRDFSHGRIENPYPEGFQEHFDWDLRDFMLRHELRASTLRVEILDSLIVKEMSRSQHASAQMLTEQAI